MKLPRSKFAAISLATSLSLISTASFSAAFGIAENSALGIGNAFAGGAASAEDASTVWYNPAGMTRIKGNQIVQGIHLIAPSFDYDDEGSTTALGAPIAADGSEDGGRFAIVPNLFYVHSLSNDLKVGVGINAPFGLATKYGNDWVGKYHAIESEIVTVNVNPAIAWKATPSLSLGFGVNIQYIEATLNNKIDFTTVCFSSSAGTSTCGGVPGSSTNDGFVHLEADDISFGFNFGALYQLSEQTRVGIAYRSEVSHDLEGDADFTIPTAVATGFGPLSAGISAAFADTDVKAQPDMPASLSMSIHHQWNNRVAVMADATWVGWSSLPNLTILFDNPLQPDGVEELRLKDNIRLSVGATYTADGPWTFRTGIAFDEGAARNATSRSARFPDNDRYWLTFGASYQLNHSMSIDTGYAHIFVPDTKINRVGGSSSLVTGEYESDADILSAQLRWDM
ncbi:MAG: long chain fatty acid transport protein [Piscirickettsiaceae bacterium]|nr:MAG: long chain fatty acid transport protein [Piscirickettsiaceae bacterium]